MSAEHILDMIAGAIDTNSVEGSARWRPPELSAAPAPAPASPPPPCWEDVEQLTILLQYSSRIEVLDIPRPRDVVVDVNVELMPEVRPHLLSRSFQGPQFTTKIILRARLDEDGYTYSTGSAAVVDVLRRIIETRGLYER